MSKDVTLPEMNSDLKKIEESHEEGFERKSGWKEDVGKTERKKEEEERGMKVRQDLIMRKMSLRYI